MTITQEAGPAPASTLATMLDVQNETFTAWLDLGSAMLRAGHDTTGELSSFWLRRFGEDVALQRRLAACTTPDEVRLAWSAFGERAVAQYGEEIGRCLAIGRRVAAELASAIGANGSKPLR